MLITHKLALRVGQYAALAGSVITMLSAGAVFKRWVTISAIEPVLISALSLVGIFAVMHAILIREFSRASGSSAEPELELSRVSRTAVLRWCPPILKFATPVGLALALGVILAGRVKYQLGEPMEYDQAISLLLFFSAALLAGVPLLASGARMPGAYSDHFHPPKPMHQSASRVDSGSFLEARLGSSRQPGKLFRRRIAPIVLLVLLVVILYYAITHV